MSSEGYTTKRTKKVISDWSGQPLKIITLDTHLDRLRTNHRDELRYKVNFEFKGEGHFPITPVEWESEEIKTVRNLRDLAEKKRGKDHED